MQRTSLWLMVLMLMLSMTAWAATIGKTTVDLDGKNICVTETNLGDFIADAVRAVGKTDIGIVQATVFRDGILLKTGDIEEQTLRVTLTSPTSPIVTMELTPKMITQMLERAVSKAPKANNSFLLISGMTVTYDSSKPELSRVTAIKIKDKLLSSTDDTTKYSVALPRELGVGGAGYLHIFTAEIIKKMKVTENTIFDAMKAAFTNAKGEINPKIDGRLKDVAAKGGS